MSTAAEDCFSRDGGGGGGDGDGSGDSGAARDENGSCNNQSIANQSSGEESLDDPLRKMRKGLFGRSASYLQGDESGESVQKEIAIGTKEKIDESGIGSTQGEPMEVDTAVAQTSITTAETVLEKGGNSIADELAAADGAEFACKGQNSLDGADAEREQIEAEQKKGRGDTEETQVTTVTTITNTEYVYESKGSMKSVEESRVEIVRTAEVDSCEAAESDVDTIGCKEENNTAVTKETFTAAKSEGTTAKMESSDEAKGDEEEIHGAGDLAKKESDAEKVDSEEVSTTKSTAARSRKKRVSQTVMGGTQGETDGGNAASERRKSLRARKVAVSDEAQAAKNEQAAEERRKSLRTPKKPPAVTPPPAAVTKTSRHEKKAEKSASETESAEGKTGGASLGRGSRKNAPGTAAGASKSAQKAPKKETVKKRRGRASESDKDPFSFDSNFDNHPEPLRNIQMERQSFGGYKFTKSPEKSPALRYQKTEQTANERRSNLIGLFPQQEASRHKSISELALSASRQSGIASTSKRKTKSSGGDFSAHMEPGGSSHGTMDATDESMQEDETEAKRKVTSTEQKRTQQSAYDFQPAPKQRKRKMAETTPAVTPKRPSKTVLPELSANEQQEADRRPNEHAPYSVGARIYALWDRLYYPARISGDQDASGRYEVVFVDGAVRRLVGTGIIPITNLVAGRKCLATNVKDGEEVLEEVEIVEAPSIDDAEQWMHGIFTVKNADNENMNKPSWEKMVLDANQAKSLQAATVNTVRDVNTDNIASVERRRSRAARHSAVYNEGTPVITATPTPRSHRRRAAASAEKGTPPAKRAPSVSAPNAEEPHTEGEQEQEASAADEGRKKASPVGKIFEGITFVVTSAAKKNKEGNELVFSKKEIRATIDCGGGKVVDDVSKLPVNEPIYLIADNYYRTHKYLTALTRGIPCVSHVWIIECAKANRLLDHKKYMLPAGVSLLTGELKPWHSKNSTLLSGKCAYIFSNNVFFDMPNFAQIWTPLISHMGGTVVPTIPADGLDILLTDASCTEEILNKAQAQGAVIVSSEWIIQAIIHGSLPAPDAHERFKYDYSGDGSSS